MLNLYNSFHKHNMLYKGFLYRSLPGLPASLLFIFFYLKFEGCNNSVEVSKI